MAGYGYVASATNKSSGDVTSNTMTIGRVIDTNDPQQMGRVRAFCTGLGDSTDQTVGSIPWALYVSPLGGVTTMGVRSETEDEVSGPVAYGMWNIPKVGAYVLVGCIEGNKAQRFYMGCVQPQYLTHTMPHGRFTFTDKSEHPKVMANGPLDTNEQPIQPTYNNMKAQFKKRGEHYAGGMGEVTELNSIERFTRGVDNQVSAITNIAIEHEEDNPGSEFVDHVFGDFEKTTVEELDKNKREIRGTGYGISQQEKDREFKTTKKNYDSMIYSWTTPGFHSISMDDRYDNSRVRIRTTSGHQILMDDTNERIYINTAKGETWLEMDKAGNIDIFAAKDVSTHAGGDISFTTDRTFRIKAKEGIHMVSDEDIRLHAKASDAVSRTLLTESVDGEGKRTSLSTIPDPNEPDWNGIHLKSGKKIHVECLDDMHTKVHKISYTDVQEDMHLKVNKSRYTTVIEDMHTLVNKSSYTSVIEDIHVSATKTLNLMSGDNTDIKTGAVGKWTTSDMMHHLAGGNMHFTAGPDIHLNGPAAAGAASATPSEEAEPAEHAYESFYTARIPEHEPWPRVYSKSSTADLDLGSSFSSFPTDYRQDEVGKVDRDNKPIERNKHWHR